MKKRKLNAALLEELTDDTQSSVGEKASTVNAASKPMKISKTLLSSQQSAVHDVPPSEVRAVSALAEDEDMGTAMGQSMPANASAGSSKRVEVAMAADSTASGSRARRLAASVGALTVAMFPGVSPALLEERLARGLPLDLKKPEVDLQKRSRQVAERERLAKKRAALAVPKMPTSVQTPQPVQISSPAPTPATTHAALTKKAQPAPVAAAPLPAKSGSLFAMALALGPKPAAPSVTAGVAAPKAGGLLASAQALGPSSASIPLRAEAAQLAPIATLQISAVPDSAVASTAMGKGKETPEPAVSGVQASKRTLRLKRQKRGWGMTPAQIVASKVQWRIAAYESAALASLMSGSVSAMSSSPMASNGAQHAQVSAGSGSASPRPSATGKAAQAIGTGMSLAEMAESMRKAEKASALAGGKGLGVLQQAKVRKQADKARAADTAKRQALPPSMPPQQIARALTRPFFASASCPAWPGAPVSVTRCPGEPSGEGHAGVVAWVGTNNWTLLVHRLERKEGQEEYRPVVLPKAGTWLSLQWPTSSLPTGSSTGDELPCDPAAAEAAVARGMANEGQLERTVNIDLEATMMRPDQIW